MRITSISINNFRLLEKISVNLEEDITLIVGRNNTGKSSLADLCIDLLEKQNELKFVDFSNGCYPKFRESYEFYKEYLKSIKIGEDEKDQLIKKAKIEETLPKITLEILIEYDKEKDTNLTGLSTYIMDLDVSRNDALILVEFSADDTLRLFSSYQTSNNTEAVDLIAYLNKNIKSHYSIKTFAIDKNKREYKRKIEKDNKNSLQKVFITRSITAQRGVDDNSKDNKKTLGKGFERYYKNTKPNDDKAKIDALLKVLSNELEIKYQALFNGILTGLKTFGGETPTKIPEITIKSIFEGENVLNKNIHYFYNNGEDILLPENYNGLGYSNLIYMVLQFASFFEEFKNMEPKPAFLFLILEEPEAHMHPQMQQVFIKNIKRFLTENGDCAQVIITTHSSHILAESGLDDKKGFDRIRYFDKSKHKITVRDLSELKIVEDPENTKKFLRQYLTLHKCDLFFADKIILVEGPTERMLLPQMLKLISDSLQNEYISIVEVGGAYAHRFKDLLEFINVKTLIITDIDSVDQKDVEGEKKGAWSACPVKIGAKTSNSVLKKWVPQKDDISTLLGLEEADKITNGNKIRVAYQIPEIKDGKCGRSLEEALILKNSKKFSKNAKLITTKDYFDIEVKELEDTSYTFTENLLRNVKKTGFIFDLILMTDWDAPKYFIEGLQWLEKDIEPIEIEHAPLMAIKEL